MSAISPLRFRIEGENSSALRAISDVKRHAHDLGGELQRNIGDKLANVFSAAAIEELVRRTAEWADALKESADALGTDVETLQSLEIMAKRAGVSTDKLNSFYQKLESAATKAKSANDKLGKSFDVLGVSWEKLKGPKRLGTVELGQTVLANALKPGGQGALQEMGLGKAFIDIRKMARESGGKTTAEQRDAYASQIVGKEDIDSISTSWKNMISDWKSVIVKFAFVPKAILAIINELGKMLSGAFDLIVSAARNPIKLVKAIITGKPVDMESWKDDSAKGRTKIRSMWRGAANSITGMVSLGKWRPFGEGNGSDEDRKGEGAGEALATFGTFGYGGIAKALGLGAKGMSATATGLGATKIGETIGKAGGIGEMGSGILKEGLFGRVMSAGQYAYRRANIRAMVRKGGLSTEQLAKLKKAYDTPREVLGGESLIGMTATSLLQSGLSDAKRGNTSGDDTLEPPDRRGIFSSKPGHIGGGDGGGGAGSGNLAIGGVFGVDIQSKILTLKMVDLLQQIVVNTAPDMSGGGDTETGGAGD